MGTFIATPLYADVNITERYKWGIWRYVGTVYEDEVMFTQILNQPIGSLPIDETVVNPRPPLGDYIRIRNTFVADLSLTVTLPIDSIHAFGAEGLGGMNSGFPPTDNPGYAYGLATIYLVADWGTYPQVLPRRATLRLWGRPQSATRTQFHLYANRIYMSAYSDSIATLDMTRFSPITPSSAQPARFVLVPSEQDLLKFGDYYFCVYYIRMSGTVPINVPTSGSVWLLPHNIQPPPGSTLYFEIGTALPIVVSPNAQNWGVALINDNFIFYLGSTEFTFSALNFVDESSTYATTPSVSYLITLSPTLSYTTSQIEEINHSFYMTQFTINEASNMTTTATTSQSAELSLKERSGIVTTSQAYLSGGIQIQDTSSLTFLSSILLLYALQLKTTSAVTPASTTVGGTHTLRVEDKFASWVESGAGTPAAGSISLAEQTPLSAATTSTPLEVRVADTSNFLSSTVTTTDSWAVSVQDRSSSSIVSAALLILPIKVEEGTAFTLAESIGEAWKAVYIEESSPLWETEVMRLPTYLDVVEFLDILWKGGQRGAALWNNKLRIIESSSATQTSKQVFDLLINALVSTNPLGGGFTYSSMDNLKVGELTYIWSLSSSPLHLTQSIEETSSLSQGEVSTPLTVHLRNIEHYLVSQQSTIGERKELVLKDRAQLGEGESWRIEVSYMKVEDMPPHWDGVNLFIWRPPSEEGDDAGATAI